MLRLEVLLPRSLCLQDLLLRCFSFQMFLPDVDDMSVDAPEGEVPRWRALLARVSLHLAVMAIPIICRRLFASWLPALDVHRMLAGMSFGPTEHHFILWRRVRATAFHAERIR